MPVTDKDLIAYSGEHVLHELVMFWRLAAIVPGEPAGFLISALLESWVIHLRNLIDFFYLEGHDDDVTARDFFDSPATWEPTMPPLLKIARVRANKELSHLTLARKSGSSTDKEWKIDELLKEIETIAKEFAIKASANKVNPKIREFLGLPTDQRLVWIRQNVIQTNVAVNVLGYDSASTATVLKHGTFLPPDKFSKK